MRFWDTSALAPLLVASALSPRLRGLHAEDDRVVVWPLTEIELRSALVRLRRDGRLTTEGFDEAIARAAAFPEACHVVSLLDAPRGSACCPDRRRRIPGPGPPRRTRTRGRRPVGEGA